ncbi:MAG: xanthine dehydrogenase accessory protein XdhC [Bdellovibrionales bacterium RBG_16_40_8]|nr:MAG: xanthine dehydrogenase accessory protein XdhC [Bdellovibrionales bacterium RBG_16_40_8]
MTNPANKPTGEPYAVVTVIETKGSSPRDLGAKMLVNKTGLLYGTIGGGHLEELAIVAAQETLKSSFGAHYSRKFQYPLSEKAGQCCGGFVEIFVEPVNTGPQLFILGAGHIGTAVANALTGTAFKVHVIDERSEWCNSDKLSTEIFKHQINPIEFVSSWGWDFSRSWVIVMTHSHDLDRSLMQNLTSMGLPFLGLIGSQTKWRRFRSRLSALGVSEEKLASVHCPVGIEIGGKTPQEIAISISAQIIKTYYEKDEHLLRSLRQQQPKPTENTTKWLSTNDDPCESTERFISFL